MHINKISTCFRIGTQASPHGCFVKKKEFLNNISIVTGTIWKYFNLIYLIFLSQIVLCFCIVLWCASSTYKFIHNCKIITNENQILNLFSDSNIYRGPTLGVNFKLWHNFRPLPKECTRKYPVFRAHGQGGKWSEFWNYCKSRPFG